MRTDLSIGAIGTTFDAVLHRHGPVGPSVEGMPNSLMFMISLDFFVESGLG